MPILYNKDTYISIKTIYDIINLEGELMKLLFKQRAFTWFDCYNIYDENENIVFRVEGEFSLGHQLRIYNSKNKEVGLIKQKVPTLLPKFIMYENGIEIGEIRKELSFMKPRFFLTCNDWEVEGNIFEWDYQVVDSNNNIIMKAYKILLNFTDTYEIDVEDDKNALYAVMIVLAIDAAKCGK